ncbi:unnamed protein product [Amoebophrya sp. A25]|nr:unnamed protein product [Amoebophrya sp. A25]|eukprot:GSA25T00016342001.1
MEHINTPPPAIAPAAGQWGSAGAYTAPCSRSWPHQWGSAGAYTNTSTYTAATAQGMGSNTSSNPPAGAAKTFYVESETRLFIGAMGPNIQEKDLRSYFSTFGAITECNLKADLNSGKSKGYAFISFEDPEAIRAVLDPRNLPHRLQDKVLDVKRAMEIAETDVTTSQKIFVGALPESCTSEKLKNYFSKYGPITGAVVITDHETNQSRGFGFVNFRNPQSVTKCLDDYHEHFLDDKWVETKCCLPREGGQRSRPTGRPGGVSTEPTPSLLVPSPPWARGIMAATRTRKYPDYSAYSHADAYGGGGMLY